MSICHEAMQDSGEGSSSQKGGSDQLDSLTKNSIYCQAISSMRWLRWTWDHYLGVTLFFSFSNQSFIAASVFFFFLPQPIGSIKCII